MKRPPSRAGATPPGKPEPRRQTPGLRPPAEPAAPGAAGAERREKPARELKLPRIGKVAPAKASRATDANRITRDQLRAERERLLLLRESNRKSKRSTLRQMNREAKRFGRNRRQVRAIRITALSAFGALIALVLATLFTPLLAINKIEVSGLHRIKSESILAAVKSQIGVPLTMVDGAKIAEQLKGFKLIESFSTVALPPHTLQIRVIERQPVCIVTVAGVNHLYDVAGVELGQAKASDHYPVVSISGSPKNSKNYADAIQVLLALPVNLVRRVEVVEARSQDNVVIQLKGLAGQQILWGDASKSALKAKVLAQLIKHVPRSRVATIDVSAPTAPVVRYGN